MDLDHHVGAVPDRAHEGVPVDDLRLVALGLELLARLRDLGRNVFANRAELSLQLLDLRDLRGGERRGLGGLGRDVARVLHLFEPGALTHRGEQVLGINPARRVHRQIHGRVGVGDHDVAAARDAQAAGEAAGHAAQRLEHAILQARGQALGEGLVPLAHDAVILLAGMRLRAAQDPRVRERGRGTQRCARRLVERPRPLQLSLGGEAQASRGDPAGLVPHGDRERLQFGGIDRVGDEEEMMGARVLQVDDAGGLAHLDGGGDRDGGLGFRDLAVGRDLEGRVR